MIADEGFGSKEANICLDQSFDKVTLLYEGRQIYFGPVDSAADYFQGLGFVKPSRATTADFLTSLTNPAERIIQEGWEDRAPKSPDDFVAVWKRSPQAKRLMEDIKAFDSAHPLRKSKPTREMLE